MYPTSTQEDGVSGGHGNDVSAWDDPGAHALQRVLDLVYQIETSHT